MTLPSPALPHTQDFADAAADTFVAVTLRKARHHGGNVQAIMRPDALPLWTGPPGPGRSTTSLQPDGTLPAFYRTAAPGMPCLADSGYEGAGTGILSPVRNPPGKPGT